MPPKLMEDGSVEETFWSLQLTWLWMLLNSTCCLIFAAYFDNALPNSYGRSEGYFFCLKQKFWCASKMEERKTSSTGNKEDRSDLKRHIDTETMSVLVQNEANRMIEQKWNADAAMVSSAKATTVSKRSK